MKLDSRLVCNAKGHPGWPKRTYYDTPGMHIGAIFTQNTAITHL